MAEPLKNRYGRDVPVTIARMVARVHRAFPEAAFIRDALSGYDALELMQRGRQIAACLRAHLPGDYPKAIDILVRSLGPKNARWDGADDAQGLGAFLYLPHVFFIATHGLEHFELSMRAQYELTQRFTAEWSIRPYLERYPKETLALLKRWCRDESPHVRRLVSEGTRPRLPWAPRLRAFQRDPRPVLELLELLKDDPALYVRRSVANNLNDIGKDHPALLVATARRWMAGASPAREWIVRHALRSAVKAGDPEALEVLGYGGKAAVTIEAVRIHPARVQIGAAVNVEFSVVNSGENEKSSANISTGRSTNKSTNKNPSKRTSERANKRTNERAQRVMVDFRVFFVKANGKSAPKVFKLKALELAAGESARLSKRVSLAQLTTRKHYPGVHRVEVMLNGVATPLGRFQLVE